MELEVKPAEPVIFFALHAVNMMITHDRYVIRFPFFRRREPYPMIENC
jgi:hypothetical protein